MLLATLNNKNSNSDNKQQQDETKAFRKLNSPKNRNRIQFFSGSCGELP